MKQTPHKLQDYRIRSVSIGEIAVSRAEGEMLVAYGLGSCVAVCLYDPLPRIAGMLHALLPSANGSNQVDKDPTRFVDRGVPILVKTMLNDGARKDRLVAYLCGGSQILAAPGFEETFQIGRRNVETAETSLQSIGIPIHRRAIGGHAGRTVSFSVCDGRITVKTLGKGKTELV